MLKEHNSTAAPIQNKGALIPSLPQTLKIAIRELSEIQDLVQLLVDSCRYSGVPEVQAAGNVGYLVTHRIAAIQANSSVLVQREMQYANETLGANYDLSTSGVNHD